MFIYVIINKEYRNKWMKIKIYFNYFKIYVFNFCLSLWLKWSYVYKFKFNKRESRILGLNFSLNKNSKNY